MLVINVLLFGVYVVGEQIKFVISEKALSPLTVELGTTTTEYCSFACNRSNVFANSQKELFCAATK